MILNYLTIAWRNLTRNRLSSTINILGLTLGISAFILIMEYVAFEKSVNQFHSNLSRIFRVLYEISYGGKTYTWETIPPALAPRARDQFAEVTDYCRVMTGGANGIVSVRSPGSKEEPKTFREETAVYAEGSFFNVFSFPIVAGTSAGLREPGTVTISEKTARKYYGTENPIGKVLTLNNQFGKNLFTVVAVYKDFPENSDLRYELIFSLQTLANPANLNGNDWANLDGDGAQFIETYLLTQDGVDKRSLEKRLNESQKRARPKTEETIRLQAMENVHLPESLSDYYKTNGTLKFLYILQGIALLIVIIAWFNYINLATASALKRAREVGIRKVVGAGRRQLIIQFLGESALLFMAAVFIALAFVNALQPFYNHIIGKQLSVFILLGDRILPWSVAMIILGTLASGGYTAFSLSGFKPSQTLKGAFSKSLQGARLRQTLVVFQFAISIFLIGSTTILYQQMEFMQNEDLGMSLGRRFVMREPEITADSTRKQQSRSFLNDLSQQSFVRDYCMSGSVPGNFFNYSSGGVTRMNPEPEDDKINYFFTFIDDRYLHLYNIPILAGKNFTPEMCSKPWKEKDAVILNEYAMNLLGFKSPGEAVGQRIRYDGKEFEVSAVIRDYHHFSLQQKIDALVIFPQYNAHYFSVVLGGNQLQADVKSLEQLYKKNFPGNPFDYFFADEKYNLQYQSEQQYNLIFTLASALAIVIACLGLLGLATFTVTQRIKEIGIRKVLGATVLQTTSLLSRDFLILVTIALLIATPISWWSMRQWLEGFAYHTQITLWAYLASGLLAIVIALLTVSSQAIRAAGENPVDALRNE